MAATQGGRPGGPAATAARLERADRALAQGDRAAAAEHVRGALAADPACPRAYELLDRLAEAAGGAEAAAGLFSFTQPGFAGSAAAAAYLHAGLGDPARALGLLSTLVAYEPQRPWAAAPWFAPRRLAEQVAPDLIGVVIARCTSRLPDPVPAEQAGVLAPWLELARAAAGRPGLGAAAAGRLSGLAYRVGASAEAVAWSEGALRREQNAGAAPDWSALVRLGSAYRAADRPQEALDAWTAVITRDAAAAAHLVARIPEPSGCGGDTETEDGAALAVAAPLDPALLEPAPRPRAPEPDDAEVYVLLIETCLDLGDLDEAAAWAREAVTRHPGQTEVTAVALAAEYLASVPPPGAFGAADPTDPTDPMSTSVLAPFAGPRRTGALNSLAARRRGSGVAAGDGPGSGQAPSPSPSPVKRGEGPSDGTPPQSAPPIAAPLPRLHPNPHRDTGTGSGAGTGADADRLGVPTSGAQPGAAAHIDPFRPGAGARRTSAHPPAEDTVLAPGSTDPLIRLVDLTRIQPTGRPAARRRLEQVCEGRWWLNPVPVPVGVLGGVPEQLLEDRPADQAVFPDPVDATLPAGAPPSAVAGLRTLFPNIRLSFTGPVDPALRTPVADHGPPLWRFPAGAAHAVATAPVPPGAAVDRLYQTADDYWSDPLQAYDTAVTLSGLGGTALLGLMAHVPPAPVQQPLWARARRRSPLLWPRLAQAWVALGILHHRSEEPWEQSQRRSLLLRLLYGPEDWSVDAAAFALCVGAWLFPEQRRDVAGHVALRFLAAAQHATGPTGPGGAPDGLHDPLAHLVLLCPEAPEPAPEIARRLLSARRPDPHGPGWR